MATNWFSPPAIAAVRTTYLGRDPYAPATPTAQRLFRHFKPRAVGQSVLKNHDGTYTTTSEPTTTQIKAAAIYYEGGHIHKVDDAEAAALRAAGFTVVTE